MPKGIRQSKNPIEKLDSHIAHLGNIIQAIYDSAEKPDFVSGILALKAKRQYATSVANSQNKEAREVDKLLKLYPGLAKPILSALKSKILEYKALDILDKYKTSAR